MDAMAGGQKLIISIIGVADATADNGVCVEYKEHHRSFAFATLQGQQSVQPTYTMATTTNYHYHLHLCARNVCVRARIVSTDAIRYIPIHK